MLVVSRLSYFGLGEEGSFSVVNFLEDSEANRHENTKRDQCPVFLSAGQGLALGGCPIYFTWTGITWTVWSNADPNLQI